MSRCDAKSVSCEVWVCEVRLVSSFLQDVAKQWGVAYKACHRSKAMISSSGSGSIPDGTGCSSSGSSKLKRPSACSPVLPVNGSWKRPIVHVADGYPLSSCG